MIRWIVVVFVLLASGSVAADPVPDRTPTTTQTTWNQTVVTVAASLNADITALSNAIPAGAHLRRFGDGGDTSLSDLSALTRQAVVVGWHAYLGAPETLAADIASDFQTANTVPLEQKQKMIPATVQDVDRANATARRWVETELHLSGPAPVGVIVLWHPDPSGAGEPACLFVLLRGTADASAVSEIVFGLPLPN